ncbi:uncharacterized protein VTP21DRAFT_10125 [Calcarisporiella thermophila]|uniref:uncharacterized protein n=1 Tax=Calcarisporiella thermophila TaxID=911321 RepID=UPI0037447562
MSNLMETRSFCKRKIRDLFGKNNCQTDDKFLDTERGQNCSVRVMGVIVHLEASDQEGPRSIVIDDASGTIRVEFPQRVRQRWDAKEIRMGELIEVIGTLKNPAPDESKDITRFILCRGFDIKEDPLEELVHALFLVRNSRQRYSSLNIPSTPQKLYPPRHRMTPVQRATAEEWTPQVSPRQMDKPRRGRAIIEEDEVKITEVNLPTSPIVIQKEEEIDIDMLETDIDDFSLTNGLTTEIENFIRQHNSSSRENNWNSNGEGISMGELECAFATTSGEEVHRAVQELLLVGAIFEIKGRYLAL